MYAWTVFVETRGRREAADEPRERRFARHVRDEVADERFHHRQVLHRVAFDEVLVDDEVEVRRDDAAPFGVVVRILDLEEPSPGEVRLEELHRLEPLPAVRERVCRGRGRGSARTRRS